MIEPNHVARTYFTGIKYMFSLMRCEDVPRVLFL